MITVAIVLYLLGAAQNWVIAYDDYATRGACFLTAIIWPALGAAASYGIYKRLSK